MKTKSTKSLPSELKTTQDSASTSTTNSTTKKKSKKSKKFKTAAKTLLRLTPRKSSPKDATPSSSSSSTMATKKMDSMNSVTSSTVPSSTTAATSSTCQFTFGGGSSSSGLEPFQEPSSTTPMASLSAKSMPRVVSDNTVEDAASNKFIVPPQSSLFEEEVEEEEVAVVPLTAAATPITKNIRNKNRPPQEEEAVEIVPTSPMAPPPPIKLSEIVASTGGGEEEDDDDDVSVMTSTSIMTNHTLLTVKEDNNTSCYNNNNNNKNNSKSNYISSNNNKNLVVTGGNVKVVIRVRPVLSNTMEANSSCCVQVLPPTTTTTDTSENSNNNNKHQALVIQGRNNNNNGSTTDSKTFTFDEIYPPNIHQETIYTSSVLPLIHSSLECGYNATVFAYGQTGSGKTFTMMGENNKTSFLGGGGGGNGGSSKGGKVYKDWGVIPRALNDIFTRLTQQASSSPSSFRYEVTLQSVELYGEEIRDLFSNSNSKEKLKVRDVSNTKNNDTEEPEVMGATTITVSSYDEAVRYVQKSMKSRVVASTSMNEVSSRSHAITTVKITQWKKTAATTVVDGGGGGEEVMEVRQSKIHLVDLAGSESLKRTQAEGERMKEGIHINKGLTVLGRVISALAKSTPEKQYVIPYRDSKLTHLLRGSLGGNHKTLMIACVSPSSLNQEESLRCLRYASRAKYIRNKKAEANVTLEGDGVNKKEMMRMRLRMKEMESELLSQQDKMRAMSMEIQHLKKEEEDEEMEEEEKKHEEAVATTTTPATVVGHVESDVHGHEYVAVEAKGFALPNNIHNHNKHQQTQPTTKDDEMENEQMLAMKRELQSLRAERDTYRRLVEETSVACGTVAEEGESDDIIPPSSSTLTVRTEHLQTPQKMVGLQDEQQDDDDDEGDVVSPLNSPVKIHQKSRSLNSSLDQNSRDEYFYAVPQEYQQPSSQSQPQQPMQHPCVFNVAPCAGFRSFNSIVDRWFGHSSNNSSGSNNRHHRRSRSSSSSNRHHSHNLYSDDNSSVSSAMTTNSIRTTNSTRTAGSARSVRTAASDRSKSSLQAGFLGYGRRY